MRASLLARAVVVCAVPLISACSDGSAGGPTTVLPITESTPYSTVTTSTSPPTTQPAAAPSSPPTPPAGVADYVVKDGDVLVNIARTFGTTAEFIAQLNGWTDGIDHVIYQGLTIKVPSNSVTPPPAESTTPPPPTQSTTPPDPCAQGTYTITEDDTSRLKVATKVGTTVEALDAANADTPGYSAFYPGLEIKLPKKAGC